MIFYFTAYFSFTLLFLLLLFIYCDCSTNIVLKNNPVNEVLEYELSYIFFVFVFVMQ